jgi:restriction system protein
MNTVAVVAEPQYYLVRTTPDLVERGIVGVGWSDFNFAEIANAEETIRQINADYGIGRWGNQIRRFYQIVGEDVIVAPLPYTVAIGRATGGLFFDQAQYNNDRANQRRVNFPRNADGGLLTFARTSFSEAFQRRLRVQGMTVNDLGEFRDEIREALASLDSGTPYAWSNRLLEEVAKRQNSFKEKLLENIRSGKTNLKTGGTGLEDLVRELLTIEGYKAEVLSKRRFGGFADADVQASRSDRCAAVDLLVQVKHHQGYSDEHGIRQLEEVRRVHPGEYDDHRRVFLTSASVSEELKKKAETMDIAVIDGLELVDWIGEHIEKLSEKTKLALGIYEVPAVI